MIHSETIPCKRCGTKGDTIKIWAGWYCEECLDKIQSVFDKKKSELGGKGKMGERKIITNYDKDADVMYVSFYDPPLEADFSQKNRNCIFRYRDLECIGVTILDWKGYHLSGETTKG